MLGLFEASATNMESINFFSPSEYMEDVGCLYCAFMTAIAIEPPWSVVFGVSNGECEYANAYNVHPKDFYHHISVELSTSSHNIPICQLSRPTWFLS